MSHIKNTTTEVAWCGRELKEEFYFKDIEQAVINGRHGTRLMCADCVFDIVMCLEGRVNKQLELEELEHETETG